ncbi:hypothetical protein BDR05DRAFT_996021 [Suillus weaverae]|nr:hypothetical protein BDR05DRAFT_996021 [Suillus weaverae]
MTYQSKPTSDGVPNVKPSAPLDVMFLQDATGGQQPYIKTACNRITQICNTLLSGVSSTN